MTTLNRIQNVAFAVLATTLACTPVASAQPNRQLAVRLVNASVKPAKGVASTRVTHLRLMGNTTVSLAVRVTDATGRVGFDVPRSLLAGVNLRLD